MIRIHELLAALAIFSQHGGQFVDIDEEYRKLECGQGEHDPLSPKEIHALHGLGWSRDDCPCQMGKYDNDLTCIAGGGENHRHSPYCNKWSAWV